jgi:hypothetical protein
MVLERKTCPVNARRTKDGPGGQGEPGAMLGSRGVVIGEMPWGEGCGIPPFALLRMGHPGFGGGFEKVPHLKSEMWGT